MRQLKITQKVTQTESLSFNKYLKDICKLGLIDSDKEIELAHQISDGSEEALQEITLANLRFVVSVAKQYQNRGLSLDDLINEGNLGLIRAAKRFDPTKGFKFISYAVWWIRQAILQAITENSRLVRLPLNRIGPHNKVHNAHLCLMQELEREPSVYEIAEFLDMAPHEVENVLNGTKKHFSVHAPIGSRSSDDNFSILDTLACHDDDIPESILEEESLQTEINFSLSILSARESFIVSSYYGLRSRQSMTLEEIGRNCGLTRERVRQIKERAIRRLRKCSNRNNLLSFMG
jgi:RNA polymerase primary sigma factor